MAKYPAVPSSYEEGPRPQIELLPVSSSQIKAVGYDAATQTLAVTFTRGAGAIYHYPGVSPETHAEMMAAESIGKFFGERIQSLGFLKFPPEPMPEAQPTDGATA